MLIRKSTTLQNIPWLFAGIQEESCAILSWPSDICPEHSLIGWRNCLMTEAANSLSAVAGPEVSTTRNLIVQYSFGSGNGRTHLGSGLRAVAPRCLIRENAGRTMTVLHHALCGDDFDQTPVSINLCGKCSIFVYIFSFL